MILSYPIPLQLVIPVLGGATDDSVWHSPTQIPDHPIGKVDIRVHLHRHQIASFHLPEWYDLNVIKADVLTIQFIVGLSFKIPRAPMQVFIVPCNYTCLRYLGAASSTLRGSTRARPRVLQFSGRD